MFTKFPLNKESLFIIFTLKSDSNVTCNIVVCINLSEWTSDMQYNNLKTIWSPLKLCTQLILPTDKISRTAHCAFYGDVPVRNASITAGTSIKPLKIIKLITPKI